MSAPNLKSPTTITGKTAVLVVTTTATAIISNAADSGKCLRLGSLIVSNITTTASANITVDLYRGSTAYRLAYLVGVSPGYPFSLIGKNEALYLEEGDSLRLTASANSHLESVASYEEVS